MIKRLLESAVKRLATQYPVVTIVGPRQAGKSTLCQLAFPNLPVINLERPDIRARISADPLQFITSQRGGCVIDEIQYLPELASYIQVAVDERKSAGEFILTGSQQFQLMETVSQSLAGRTAIVKLLPLSLRELKQSRYLPSTLDDLLFTGSYPRIYADKLAPTQTYSFYVQTYIERDIRTLINVRDLTQFERFVKLCAARAGQLLNLSNLGNEAGIDHSTAQRWITALEASFIVFRLPPHFSNFSKRIIKSPKLYFYDTGLLSFLLNIRDSNDLTHHPLRGQIFENYIAGELVKNAFNAVDEPNIYFFRDSTGHEIDFLLEHPDGVIPIEVKASMTFSPSFLDTIHFYKSLAGARVSQPKVIYGGEESFSIKGVDVLPWREVDKINFSPTAET
jgi:predicted AAA+ superfamily ATPase